MKIKVLLFAQLKEAYGSGDLWLDLPAPATIRDAMDRVMSEKKLSQFKGLPLLFAVNEGLQSEGIVLNDGDCLALLSPVSGG